LSIKEAITDFDVFLKMTFNIKCLKCGKLKKGYKHSDKHSLKQIISKQPNGNSLTVIESMVYFDNYEVLLINFNISFYALHPG